MRISLATGNRDKVREISEILGGIDVVPAPDGFDVDETDEMRVIITSATGTKTISRGVARMRVGDQITLVEKAFAGPPLFAGRWARLDGGDGSSRQVPLAITLMGSPVR